MRSRTKWIGISGLAACVVLTGTLWVGAQPNDDDCHGRRGWGLGFWRSSNWSDGYAYRVSEPEFATEEEFATNGVTDGEMNGYVTRNDEPARSREFHGLRTRPITSTAVRLSSGGDIGRIEELVINNDGTVDYMIVSFMNMPRLETKLAAIPWEAAQIDLRGRVAVLDMDRDALFGAPIFFNRGSFPNLYEGEWATRVHSHFGLDATRIERAYSEPETRDSDRTDMKARPQQDRIETRERINQPARDPRPMPQGRGTQPNSTIDRNIRPSPNQDSSLDRTAKPAPSQDSSLERNAQPAPNQNNGAPPRPQPAPDQNNDDAKQNNNESEKPKSNNSNLPD